MTTYTKQTLTTTNWAHRGGEHWKSEFGIAIFDRDRFGESEVLTSYTKQTMPTSSWTKQSL